MSCKQECDNVLLRDSKSIKGHYILGLALVEIGKNTTNSSWKGKVNDGIQSMKTALNLDKVENAKRFSESINESMKKANMILYLRENETKKHMLALLSSKLPQLISNYQKMYSKQPLSGEEI